MNWVLYVMAGWICSSVLLVICSIGKPRKPLAPGQAAYITLINAAFIVVLVLAARRLA
jgi:hypothetical protein